MSKLTKDGQRVVGELAQRHSFSREATEHMVVAVLNGNGQMAQFSHPEFSGSGQWMRGGMIMISDMFNNYLKGRIDSLCCDVANAIAGPSSLFVPDPEQYWWPQELGSPNATGSQNQTKYAYFANAGRLAVQTGKSVWVYDTQDHQIGGFSQQQGIGGNITLTSQFGNIQLASLPVVMKDGVAVTNAAPSSQVPMKPDVVAEKHADPSSTSQVQGSPTSAQFQEAPITPIGGFEIVAMIEKLADLKAKGVLSDEEFSEKKKELLARL